jgi:hypothetical protein
MPQEWIQGMSPLPTDHGHAAAADNLQVSAVRANQQWKDAFNGSRLSLLNITLPRSTMFQCLQPLGDTLVALILHAPRTQLSMSRTLLTALTGVYRQAS